MKRYTVAFLLAASAFTTVSCTESSASITEATRITLSPDGITVNSKHFSRPVPFEQLQAALGRPSRIKINTPSEAAEKKRKFGTEANDLYTYDNIGLVIYRKHNAPNASSLSLEFNNEGLSYSPHKNFSGTFSIGQSIINRNTTVSQLQSIGGLHINISPMDKHAADYGQNSLLFDFDADNTSEIAKLMSVGIELGSIEKANSMGWTMHEVVMMETMFSNATQLQQVATKLDIKPSTLAHCFSQKVSSAITKEQLQSPDESTKAKLQTCMESCVSQLSN